MAFFEVSRPAQRRVRLAESLPTQAPPQWEVLTAAISALPDPEVLCAEVRAGSMRAAQKVLNQVDAYLTGLAGAADRHADASVLRAGTTGTMVAALTGQTQPAGSAIVATAAALRILPGVSAAFAEGRIGRAQVRAINAAAGRIDDFAEVEAAIVTLAETVDAGELRGVLRVLVEQCHPQTLDKELEDQRRKRGVSLSQVGNGMFRLDGYLDQIAGHRLRDALAKLMDRPAPGDDRTPTQRRADALDDLVSMAIASSAPMGVSGLSILIDVDQLSKGTGATLDGGARLGPATLDLLSCSAACAAIFGVKHKGTFMPLALARTARRASAAQWAALIARDRGCIRCGRAPRFCQAHHIVHWKNGGLTDLSNLALLCSRCHHDLHLGHYVITVASHGEPIIQATRAPPAA